MISNYNKNALLTFLLKVSLFNQKISSYTRAICLFILYLYMKSCQFHTISNYIALVKYFISIEILKYIIKYITEHG